MNPPRHAAVVSIDEKSQIQALDRTRPGLPLKRGKCSGAGLARRTSAMDVPLHADLLLLAQCVEGFFSKLTRQSLKRGVFRSVDDLESAITRYIAVTNRNPKPFVWTATAKTIQANLMLNHPSSQCTSRLDTATRMMMDADFSDRHPSIPRALPRERDDGHLIKPIGTSADRALFEQLVRIVNEAQERDAEDEHQLYSPMPVAVPSRSKRGHLDPGSRF
jgi:hypothetical protein